MQTLELLAAAGLASGSCWAVYRLYRHGEAKAREAKRIRRWFETSRAAGDCSLVCVNCEDKTVTVRENASHQIYTLRAPLR